MEGVYIRLFMRQSDKHRGLPLHEWLLEHGKCNDYKGGTVFISMASFGRDGRFSAEHFFSLGGEVTLEVAFALTEQQSSELFDFLKKEELELFFIKSKAEFGTIKK